jgi:hypothetical protein
MEDYLKTAMDVFRYCGGLYLLYIYIYIYLYLLYTRIVYGASLTVQKSVNRWGSFGAKGGVVPPSVFNQLLKCADQIHFILHYFLAYLYFRQYLNFKNQSGIEHNTI